MSRKLSMSDAFPSRFTSPDDSPGFLLWQITNLWQRRQRAALEPLGLTHVQFVLLATLGWLQQARAPVTQVQLAQHARTDIMMTSEVVRSLERRGLLTRADHPTDSRALALALTAEGQALVARSLNVVEEVDRAFFAPVGDDLQRLIEVFRGLRSEQ